MSKVRKETTKKIKINIMDIFVILVAVVCIVTVVLSATSSKKRYEQKQYQLYFQIDDIKSSSYSFFEGHEGENVRIKSSGEFLGTLGAEFSRGAAIYTYNENGDNKQYYYPESSGDTSFSHERCSINGFIVLSGEMTKDGFLVNDQTLISLNQEIEIVTEYIQVTIRVISIEEK